MRTLLILAALALVSACTADQAAPPPTPTSFDPAVSDTPGALLSRQAINAAALIPGAATGSTFLYRSTDGLDGTSPITVSGAVYLPEGDAPADGWPLIAWSHGTVGVADRCAPSTNGRSERDLTYLSNWLRKGYAIVASDYQGLGSEGPHPYMATRPMAYSNLDAIRAVQQGAFPVSKAVVVTGQSQGASGAIATAGYAPAYAPEIDLRGISATGVPYFPPVIQQMLTQVDPATPTPQNTYTLYLMILAEALDPTFRLQDAVDPAVWPTVSKAYDQCVFELTESVMADGLTPGDISTPAIVARQPKVFEALAYPTLKLSVPAFVGSGEVDTVTPLPMQRLFVQRACAAGSTIEARQYAGAGHNGGLLNSMGHVEAFVAKAFAGEDVAGNCP
ncbi:MAG: lipase family protein [Erythrobacter sp.]|nr:lipase family protein [Erythrobacter sp.]